MPRVSLIAHAHDGYIIGIVTSAVRTIPLYVYGYMVMMIIGKGSLRKCRFSSEQFLRSSTCGMGAEFEVKLTCM